MNQPEWRISDGAVPYAEALAVMEGRVADIRAGREREVALVEQGLGGRNRYFARARQPVIIQGALA